MVPDALSRLVPDLGEMEEKTVFDGVDARCDLVTVTSKISDSWYNQMLQLVQTNPLRYSAWHVDGLQLLKYCAGGNSTDELNPLGWKRVVPRTLRAGVLRENHDAPGGEHLGVHRTYYRIKQCYYWSRMREDVARYVRHCAVCQRNKVEHQSVSSFMSSHPSYRTMTDVINRLFRSTA